MSITLYRKYRPQKWADLTGQEHIKLTLEQEIKSGQLAHAYLFSGPRGIGKTTIARLIAKSLNCLKRQGEESEPCNECVSCEEITNNSSLDVSEIDAASHTGVDNVRENIIEYSRFAPSRGKYKIFILDEAHMLSLASFNALLKILEEPPSYIIFILATTELHKIPETIVSRCQTFEFKKIGLGDLKKRLILLAQNEGFELTDDVLSQIAIKAQGCLRDAESLLGQLFSLGVKKITADEASLVLPRSNFAEIAKLLNLLAVKDLAAALTHFNSLIEQGLDLINFHNNLLEFLRLVLHQKIAGKMAAVELDQASEDELTKLAEILSLEKIVEMVEVFLKQKAALRVSHIPQLPLELAMVNICLDKATKEVKDHTPPEPLVVKSKLEKVIKNEAPEEVLPSITLDLIKEKWQNYLNKVRDYNHALPFILKMSQPLEINGRTIKISLKYSFHCEKLNELKTKQLAEKALMDVYGSNLFLEPVLIEEIEMVEQVESAAADNLVANLAQAFGGQVVE